MEEKQTKKSAAKGSDWTRLLTDSDLSSHLGQLLQTYREVAPEKREQALLRAMREIKESAVKARAAAAGASPDTAQRAAENQTSVMAAPEPVTEAPPFEPDLFTPVTGDRRHYPRIKCFVAVEIRVDRSEVPIWGNLSNVGRGGCFVETATPIPAGDSVEIGLWLANGKIWVKGLVLTGTITRNSPNNGVRVRFSELETCEKEHLREFLKVVESTTRKAHSANSYISLLKR
jgi:hypothetical protein